MPSDSTEINISTTGTYPRGEMPENLRDALAEEVKKHLEGYGCKDVVVRFQSVDALKTVSFKVK